MTRSFVVVVVVALVVALLAPVTSTAEVLASGQARVMGGGTPRYTGARISLDFKDADVKDVLRFLADFGKFNLVLDESVKGKITIKLNDVPWDQALDIILRNNGLAADVDPGVVRAASATKLQSEIDSQRRLREQQALAAPLKTVTYTLSYAKARDVAKIVEKLLSPRGTIIVDARTNTIIVQDVPAKQETMDAAVALADR